MNGAIARKYLRIDVKEILWATQKCRRGLGRREEHSQLDPTRSILTRLAMSEEKITGFLKTGKDWARLKTTVPGVFVLKLP